MSPPDARGWRLAPLSCPRCAGSLDPLPADVAYLCHACGGASELVGGRTVGREMTWVGAAAADGAAPLALPFWHLGPGQVTPAFNATRLLTATAWYSQRLARGEMPRGRPARGLWGGTIGSSDALRVCRMALDDPETIDAANDSAPSALSGPAASGPGLLGLPFRKEDNRLVCLTTGFHVYFETIEGIARLLERWAERTS